MKIIGLKSPYLLHHWKFMQGDPRLIKWPKNKKGYTSTILIFDQFLKAIKVFNTRMRFGFSLNSKCFEEMHSICGHLSCINHYHLLFTGRFYEIFTWSSTMFTCLFQCIKALGKRKSHGTPSSCILLKPFNEPLVMSTPLGNNLIKSWQWIQIISLL